MKQSVAVRSKPNCMRVVRYIAREAYGALLRKSREGFIS